MSVITDKQAPSPQVKEDVENFHEPVSKRHFELMDEYHALRELREQDGELSPNDEARMHTVRDELNVSRQVYRRAFTYWCLMRAQEYAAEQALEIPGVRFPEWDQITFE